MHVTMESAEAMSISRGSVLKMMDDKNKIEKEIEELMQVLSSNRVGIHDPLVDREGYPRQDIDVYQVRHARHRIICLQNDYKAVMKQIEEGINTLHSGGSVENIEMDEGVPVGDPIAIVNKVTPGSPASLAGLEVHDKIIEFGSVNASNFVSLKNIGFIAESSVNRPVTVAVLRGTRLIRLSLVPKSWMGPGLLGCNIVLPENVDR